MIIVHHLIIITMASIIISQIKNGKLFYQFRIDRKIPPVHWNDLKTIIYFFLGTSWPSTRLSTCCLKRTLCIRLSAKCVRTSLVRSNAIQKSIDVSTVFVTTSTFPTGAPPDVSSSGKYAWLCKYLGLCIFDAMWNYWFVQSKFMNTAGYVFTRVGKFKSACGLNRFNPWINSAGINQFKPPWFTGSVSTAFVVWKYVSCIRKHLILCFDETKMDLKPRIMLF